MLKTKQHVKNKKIIGNLLPKMEKTRFFKKAVKTRVFEFIQKPYIFSGAVFPQLKY